MDRPAEAPGAALGIDFGERRIGVALSDPQRRLAVPWGVVERRNDRQAIGELAALARDEGATLLVAGEPRGLDGEAGEAARRARRFAERLARAARLPLVVVDEALTSTEAARRLAAAGVEGRAQRGRLDAVAAQILLEEGLDALARGLAAVPEAPAAEASAAPDRSEEP